MVVPAAVVVVVPAAVVVVAVIAFYHLCVRLSIHQPQLHTRCPYLAQLPLHVTAFIRRSRQVDRRI